jgi:hypothetical protein
MEKRAHNFTQAQMGKTNTMRHWMHVWTLWLNAIKRVLALLLSTTFPERGSTCLRSLPRSGERSTGSSSLPKQGGATTAEAAAAVDESGDTHLATDENNSDLESNEPFVSDHVCHWESTDDINRAALVIRRVMQQRDVGSRCLSLDAEWPVIKNARGHVTGIGKADLLQISFRINEDSPIKTHLFKVSQMLKLPVDLLGLPQEPSFTFVGLRVAGDVIKIRSDFSNCADLKDPLKTMDVGSMACRRGIQPHGGSFGLEGPSDAVLGKKMNKSSQRLDWTKKTLGAAQKKHAALDATESLEIFFKLLALPDLTAPLPKSEMKPG